VRILAPPYHTGSTARRRHPGLVPSVPQRLPTASIRAPGLPGRRQDARGFSWLRWVEGGWDWADHRGLSTLPLSDASSSLALPRYHTGLWVLSLLMAKNQDAVNLILTMPLSLYPWT